MGWDRRPDAEAIERHEAFHRRQFLKYGSAPVGTRLELEAEAKQSSVALEFGGPFQPKFAAPPGAVLGYDPTDWMPNPVVASQVEERSVREAGLTDPSSETRIGLASSETADVAEVAYEIHTTGSGPDGGIVSTTRVMLRHEPNAAALVTHGPMLRAISPETGLYAAHEVPAYPYSLTFHRTIEYRDADGRAAIVTMDGTIYFSNQTMSNQLSVGQPPSFERLLSLVGDEGTIGVHLAGRTTHASPNATHFGFETSARAQIDGAIARLGATNPYGVDTVIPSPFLDLQAPGGQQYTDLRAWLIAWDTMAMIDAMFSGEVEAGGGSAGSEPDSGLLDSFLSATADFWNSMPPWLRGILRAVGMFVGFLAAMAAIAGVIVLLAKGAIAFGVAMLIVGAVALVLGFLYNIWRRFWEWWEYGGFFGFFAIGFVALLDTVGIAGIIESITDTSLLTWRDYGRGEEERWEAGTTGVLQLVGVILAVRGLKGGPRPVAAEVQPRGPMADFHALPFERLPSNLPEGFYWQRSAGQEWVLMRDPSAPPIDLEISIYSDGQGRINYNILSEGRVLQHEAQTRPTGDTFSDGNRLPTTLRDTGVDNPYLDPRTNTPWDKGHGIDYVDALEGPGVRISNLDPGNFTPQASWWNQGVRNPLVGRIRAAGGGYREMPIYDVKPPRTANNTPIPREFIFVETDAAGVPRNAWRIPNDQAITTRGLDVLPNYEMNLANIPQVMRAPNGTMRPPGTVFGPIVIFGQPGTDEAGVAPSLPDESPLLEEQLAR